MSAHAVIAGGAQAWAVPPGRTELFGFQNARFKRDCTHYERVRMDLAGGVVGLNTCFLSLDYTLGGDVWVPIPIVLYTLIMGGSNVTQTSCWVELPEPARADVQFRVVGEAGNDVAAPSFSYIGVHFAGAPRYAANSLGGAITGRDYVFFGGSQLGGGGDPGEFGTLDPAVSALLDPLLLLGHASGGITLVVNGVTITECDPAEHGGELGFLYALALAGKAAGTRLVCRYVEGTNAAAWVTTHFATVVADVVTHGLTVAGVAYVLGSTDANSATTVAQLDNQLRLLDALKRAAWPDSGWVVMGQVTTDTVSYPQLVAARAVGERRFTDTVDGLRAYVAPDPVFALLQPGDDQHPVSAGHVLEGELIAGPFLAAGIPG